MEDYTYDELVMLIKEWAFVRDLNTADPKSQFLKVAEEMGELAEGINKNNDDEALDALGDVFVTLVVLSQQLGLSLKAGIIKAYKEIENRTGKMVNGTFVKTEDLQTYKKED